MESSEPHGTNKSRTENFNALVLRHKAMIWHICSDYSLGRAWNTEDCMQEVMVNLWRDFDKFEGEDLGVARGHQHDAHAAPKRRQKPADRNDGPNQRRPCRGSTAGRQLPAAAATHRRTTRRKQRRHPRLPRRLLLQGNRRHDSQHCGRRGHAHRTHQTSAQADVRSRKHLIVYERTTNI